MLAVAERGRGEDKGTRTFTQAEQVTGNEHEAQCSSPPGLSPADGQKGVKPLNFVFCPPVALSVFGALAPEKQLGRRLPRGHLKVKSSASAQEDKPRKLGDSSVDAAREAGWRSRLAPPV